MKKDGAKRLGKEKPLSTGASGSGTRSVKKEPVQQVKEEPVQIWDRADGETWVDPETDVSFSLRRGSHAPAKTVKGTWLHLPQLKFAWTKHEPWWDDDEHDWADESTAGETEDREYDGNAANAGDNAIKTEDREDDVVKTEESEDDAMKTEEPEEPEVEVPKVARLKIGMSSNFAVGVKAALAEALVEAMSDKMMPDSQPEKPFKEPVAPEKKRFVMPKVENEHYYQMCSSDDCYFRVNWNPVLTKRWGQYCCDRCGQHSRGDLKLVSNAGEQNVIVGKKWSHGFHGKKCEAVPWEIQAQFDAKHQQ